MQFTVGDACNLPQLGQFGCVFAGNVICRLPEPMKFFERLPNLIVPGGILFIASPYTWLEQYTAKVPVTMSSHLHCNMEVFATGVKVKSSDQQSQSRDQHEPQAIKIKESTLFRGMATIFSLTVNQSIKSCKRDDQQLITIFTYQKFDPRCKCFYQASSK